MQIIKFFFNILLGATSTTTSKYYRASQLAGAVYFEYTMKRHFADIFHLFGEILPVIFLLHLRCIYFLLYILLNQNLQQDQYQYLTYQKKCIIPYSRNISVIYYILFPLNFREDLVHLPQTEFPVLILLLQKQEHHQKMQA